VQFSHKLKNALRYAVQPSPSHHSRSAMLPAKPLWRNPHGTVPRKTSRTMDDLFLHTLQDIYYADK
jgi:hypothetical protein